MYNFNLRFKGQFRIFNPDIFLAEILFTRKIGAFLKDLRYKDSCIGTYVPGF